MVRQFANERLSSKASPYSGMHYQRLFESAQYGILIVDEISGNIVDANPSFLLQSGYTKPELTQKKLWDIGRFQNIAHAKSAFRKLQRHGYIHYKNLPLQTKDGSVIAVEFVSTVYEIDHQRFIQCNISKIHDRKKAEDEKKVKTETRKNLSKLQEKTRLGMMNVMEDLEASRNLLEIAKAKDEAMLASIGEGLIAIDNDRKITVMNTYAEAILGRTMTEMVGQEITDFQMEDEDGKPLPVDKRPTDIAMATGEKVNSISYVVRKDTTRFPISMTVTPIKLAGKIIGALHTFRDITNEKEIDRAKSEFVSLASHQLRTPLGIMKWYLEAIANETYIRKAPQTIRDYFHEMYKSNERILRLVRDLLSVSRIDQGRIKNTPVSMNLRQAIREIVETMRIIARKKNITINCIMDRTIPSMMIDPLRFGEVIQNLISNAVAYSSKKGIVDVTLKKSHTMVCIQVKDTGIGISAIDQKQLCTKFFRTKEATVYNPEGSGLGLYVLKSYVAAWGEQ